MKLLQTLLPAAALLAFSAPAVAQFSISSPGGPIPLVGTGGGGDRCTMLPTEFNAFPMSAPVPANATSITSVSLIGLSHTWVGDVQVVLRDPGGVGYNLMCRPGSSTSCTSAGDSSDFGGDYSIVPAATPGALDLEVEAAAVLGGGVVAPGAYAPHFALWVDGSAGVFNVDLASIPATPGIWALEVYDGAGGDPGALVEWCLNGDTTGVTSITGPGGPIPLVGTGGGGDRCTTLPTEFNAFPLGAPVSADATSITSVSLVGLSHTWVGDVQVVLRDPAGVGYNLMCRPGSSTSCTSAGDSSDFGGDYTIVPAATPGALDLEVEAAAVLGAGIVAPGAYAPHFALWVDGSAGVFNVDLASIPATPGIWALEVYDGAGGDPGALVAWALNTSTNSVNYCDGELNSTGASASFTASGSDSIAANDLTLHVDNLPLGSFGFFIVGDACNNVPMVGGGAGTLCVGGDVQRGLGGAILNAGMSGSVSLLADLQNLPPLTIAMPMSGIAGYPGQQLFVQYWYRDSVMGMTTSNLSNARLFVLAP